MDFHLYDDYFRYDMKDEVLSIKLMPQFEGTATELSLVEWIVKVDLACDHCELKTVTRVFALRHLLVAYLRYTKCQGAD